MPRLYLETRVHAALETVWDLMIDRAEHPGSFDSEQTEATTTERFADGFLQEVRRQGMLLKQRVTVDRGRLEIRYRILEHPLLTGQSTTRVQPTSVQSPVAPQVLSVRLDWEPTGERSHEVMDTELRGHVERELALLKKRAEELEQSA